MMAVDLHPVGGEFQFEPAHMLFQTRPIPDTWNLYDVSRTASGSCSTCHGVVQRGAHHGSDELDREAQNSSNARPRALRPRAFRPVRRACHQMYRNSRLVSMIKGVPEQGDGREWLRMAKVAVDSPTASPVN